jgi:hypothetical protein
MGTYRQRPVSSGGKGFAAFSLRRLAMVVFLTEGPAVTGPGELYLLVRRFPRALRGRSGRSGSRCSRTGRGSGGRQRSREPGPRGPPGAQPRTCGLERSRRHGDGTQCWSGCRSVSARAGDRRAAWLLQRSRRSRPVSVPWPSRSTSTSPSSPARQAVESQVAVPGIPQRRRQRRPGASGLSPRSRRPGGRRRGCQAGRTVVQAITGHADVKVTLKIHAHANLDTMRQALGKLDDRLS